MNIRFTMSPTDFFQPVDRCNWAQELRRNRNKADGDRAENYDSLEYVARKVPKPLHTFDFTQ